MTRSILFLSLLSLLGACVSAAKHEELQQKYGMAQAKLADISDDLSRAKQKLEEQKGLSGDLGLRLDNNLAELAKAQRELSEKDAQIAALKAEGERASTELADLLKDRSRLKESTERLRLALNELSARKVEADRRVAEYRTMLTRFKQLIDAGTLQVRIVEGRMVLTLASDVLFDSGSAKLSKIGKAAVIDIASVLAALSDRRIQIEGHTDNVPIHNETYASNWELAAGRAFTVLRTLTEHGVAADALSAASYGEYRPRANNQDEVGRAANRRIEIVLPPDLSMLPGAEELEKAIAQS
jgi:chemotaxis protein MotB